LLPAVVQAVEMHQLPAVAVVQAVL